MAITSNSSTKEIFLNMLEFTEDLQTAAILTLAHADALNLDDHIEHAIYMGIRNGLFGTANGGNILSDFYEMLKRCEEDTN